MIELSRWDSHFTQIWCLPSDNKIQYANNCSWFPHGTSLWVPRWSLGVGTCSVLGIYILPIIYNSGGQLPWFGIWVANIETQALLHRILVDHSSNCYVNSAPVPCLLCRTCDVIFWEPICGYLYRGSHYIMATFDLTKYTALDSIPLLPPRIAFTCPWSNHCVT